MNKLPDHNTPQIRNQSLRTKKNKTEVNTIKDEW